MRLVHPLVNALTGAKVAIVSDKPQTTRRAIQGISTIERDGELRQAVLVDLPGVQHPRDVLTERMQSRVDRALAECDVALFVLNAAERSGPGDRFLARALARAKVPVVAAVNKVDAVRVRNVAEALSGVGELASSASVDLREVYPISALRGSGIEPLRESLLELLPEGPAVRRSASAACSARSAPTSRFKRRCRTAPRRRRMSK